MTDHEYRRERARILDVATVALLRLSSPAAVLVANDTDEHARIPAYDPGPWVAGRDDLRVCIRPGCFARFWTCPYGQTRIYCSNYCRYRMRYLRCLARRAAA